MVAPYRNPSDPPTSGPTPKHELFFARHSNALVTLFWLAVFGYILSWPYRATVECRNVCARFDREGLRAGPFPAPCYCLDSDGRSTSSIELLRDGERP